MHAKSLRNGGCINVVESSFCFSRAQGHPFFFLALLCGRARRYGVGLFASLITGLILKTIGSKCGIPILVEFGGLAGQMVGPAIAVAVAQALKAPPMVVFSCAAAGFAGNAWGGPVGAFVSAIAGAEVGKAVSKETPVDIIATPAMTVIAAWPRGSS